MQTPPEIEFQGITAMPAFEAAIAQQMAALEARWERMTALVLKTRGGPHRTRRPYEAHVRLALPDRREANIDRTPPADRWHADLSSAIRDAFRHARRQLQDEVCRAQSRVKHYDKSDIGTVVRIDPSGEFGFLETRDSQEITQQRARWRVHPSANGRA